MYWENRDCSEIGFSGSCRNVASILEHQMTTFNLGRTVHLDIDEPDVGRGERNDGAGDYGAGVEGGGHPRPVPGTGRKKVLTHHNHINKN